jgi:cellulose synthase/poly-beta-1,6-N-acetylglucosamine synthase-like glycosyltransferase
VIAVVVLWVSLTTIVWVYAGYPAVLALVARARPRHRYRAELHVPVSVVVAAHDEESIIASKVANIRASNYPAALIEIIVASDGSTDGTVERATAAGASLVLDLPRVGKLTALNEAVARASGAIFVFTDADATLERETLARLVSNFADPAVGAVAANEIHTVTRDGNPVAMGEGLYWRYEQTLKRLEDAVGTTVSASGRLYALRRDVFVPSRQVASSDDFVISTQAIRAGLRLAFDEGARVLVDVPEEGGTELRRKVRVMNGGLRGAGALALALLPAKRPAYLFALLSHKILRRLVGFFLIALAASSAVLAARSPWWWLLLAPQVALYSLATAGAVAQLLHRTTPKVLWVPYYFCLSNLAGVIAVCSIARSTRYETWEPALARAPAEQMEPVEQLAPVEPMEPAEQMGVL